MGIFGRWTGSFSPVVSSKYFFPPGFPSFYTHHVVKIALRTLDVNIQLQLSVGMGFSIVTLSG
jgi:hypothetical protein